MDSPQPGTPASALPPAHAATASDATSSPSLSFTSKGYSARSSSSTSSLASSPIPRESIDGFGPSKRLLEDVTEEPQERDGEFQMIDTDAQYFLDSSQQPEFRDSIDHTSLDLPPHEYELEPETSAETVPSRRSSKNLRSGDFSLPGVTNRFGTRFPSLSKRWKNKSAAGPQLSVITHSDHVASRSSSAGSIQLISPALSAISKHESYIPSSPVRTTLDDELDHFSSDAIPVQITAHDDTNDQGQATTPLLPPLMTDFFSNHSPIHSPLQSPSIADTPVLAGSTTPINSPQMYTLPSPPLSTRPSLASIRQRSRANTTTSPPADIPTIQMLDDQCDEWSQRLGHANFNIHPEPYVPETRDLDSYRQLRANWDLARCNYGRHLARTGEHYGNTSKVYRLTEEKWAAIDAEWKKQDETMAIAIQPQIARLSDGDPDQSGSPASSAVLEKPLTRVVVPQIDDSCGKFPDLGDEGIVGPMAFAPNRFQQTLVEPVSPVRTSRKRSFLKFISDILGRGNGLRA